jgi:uncharacterized low-complexity protein
MYEIEGWANDMMVGTKPYDTDAAGQTKARQTRTGQGRADQDRAGQTRTGRAGQTRADQDRARQGRAGQGRTEENIIIETGLAHTHTISQMRMHIRVRVISHTS